jgi:hypothetical protein
MKLLVSFLKSVEEFAISSFKTLSHSWVPAFAGMTSFGWMAIDSRSV